MNRNQSSAIFSEQKILEVGILSGQTIEFEILSDGKGPRSVRLRDGKVCYEGRCCDRLCLLPYSCSSGFSEASFALYGVTIGIGFHWEQKEKQVFAGGLDVIVSDGKLVAVNRIGIEDYLLSVISSEMSSSADLEFLKAHAVISRSWVMCQLENRNSCDGACRSQAAAGARIADNGEKIEINRWYDHEDHKDFDLCADDHCQRYQGLSRAVGENVRKAVLSTWGEVMRYEGKLCDARFSKCCGGRTEVFSSCWADADYPYLVSKEDPFCAQADAAVLRRVLNDYDVATKDYLEWTETLSPRKIRTFLKMKLNQEIGDVVGMEAVRRGPSGRITRLGITGTEALLEIGKELEIRRVLSDSHLHSSAFDIEKSADGDFVLHGRGWGHGVGLCQIGAAVMAAQGYDYSQILHFYYPGVAIGCD